MKTKDTYQYFKRREKHLEIQTRKRKEKTKYPDKFEKRYSFLRPSIYNDHEYRLLSLSQLSNLIKYLRSNSQYFKDSNVKYEIKVPKNFKISSNYVEVIDFFESLISSLYLTTGSIKLDFTDCISIEIGPATLLQIILQDFFDFQYRFNTKNFKILKKDVSVQKSKTLTVTKMLHALQLLSIDKEEEEKLKGESFIPLGLKTGLKLRRGYRENIKGAICSDFRSFINRCLRAISFELNEVGKNNIDRLVSEILGNAEDHSQVNTWYVNGVSFLTSHDHDPIVEVCFSIINFGYSIYEGFELTKEKNQMIYSKMEERFILHSNQFSITNEQKYTREGLFTLYALQEGVSRLKYIDTSRGNGTMNFIRAFIDLGSFGTINKKFKPKLNIISGHTLIHCDDNYGPYRNNDHYYLSLNKDKNIQNLPNPRLVQHFDKLFPGTMLQVKIYLSRNHFNELLSNEKNRTKAGTSWA